MDAGISRRKGAGFRTTSLSALEVRLTGLTCLTRGSNKRAMGYLGNGNNTVYTIRLIRLHILSSTSEPDVVPFLGIRRPFRSRLNWHNRPNVLRSIHRQLQSCNS